jgi:Adipocyte plasma membrane-associated protein-like, N-terminal
MASKVSKVVGVGAMAIVLLGIMWLYWRSPVVAPVAWQAPPLTTVTAPLLPNARLESAEWWAKTLPGPETVAFDHQGDIVTGLADGRIVRLSPGSESVRVLGQTGGRPLAIAFGAEGILYIADAERGLLQMSADGAVTVLANTFESRPLSTLRMPASVTVFPPLSMTSSSINPLVACLPLSWPAES